MALLSGMDSFFNIALVLLVLFFAKGAIAFDDLVIFAGLGYLLLSDAFLGVLGHAYF